MKQILNSNIDPNWPAIEIDYHKPVDLFIDSFNGYDQNKDSFKILWIKEAEAISNFKYFAIKNSSFFDAIISYDDDVLNQCSNSYMLLFGTSWVHDYNFKSKTFQISHLTGNKNWTVGHKLRQEIHLKQNDIATPKDFYISSHGSIDNPFNNKVLLDSKEPLFDSQFHICIENSVQKNYFTEKLIDSLITKTVPIYFGCPNIGDFFDTRGMFLANTRQEIIDICNSLNEDSYNEKIEFIEKNYLLSKAFETICDRLQSLLKKILC